MRYLKGMQGLGDNIYQRSIVRNMGETYLITSWPQIYSDLPNVYPIRPQSRLRTQTKNFRRGDLRFYPPPYAVQPARWAYDNQGTILESLERNGHAPMGAFDLPRVQPWNGPGTTPYIVVRPATIRSEWRAAARNPIPEYIHRAAKRMADLGYWIISLADVDGIHEVFDGLVPFAHERFDKGQLQIEQVMSLVQGAAGVISGVGFMAPMCLAYKTPLLLIYGGWGAHHGPQRIFDSRLDTSRIIQAVPDAFCMCANRDHKCDKRISNLESHIEGFAALVASAKSPGTLSAV